MEQTFKPEANVNMVLHQVYDTMLSFAARVLGGEMPDDDVTTQWAFDQIYSFGRFTTAGHLPDTVLISVP